jgi:hypothetical protein
MRQIDWRLVLKSGRRVLRQITRHNIALSLAINYGNQPAHRTRWATMRTVAQLLERKRGVGLRLYVVLAHCTGGRILN